jgi:hypothetical protein
MGGITGIFPRRREKREFSRGGEHFDVKYYVHLIGIMIDKPSKSRSSKNVLFR